MRIEITVQKARDGVHDYVQIISDDMVTVNIVLVAEKIFVKDNRKEG